MAGEASPGYPVSSGDDAPKPKRHWLRRVVRIVGALLILLVILALVAPTLLSTGPGMRFLLGQVNERIPGRVNADSISLGWFSGQEINHFTLVDSGGQTILEAQAIHAPGVKLFSLLRGNLDLGTIELVNPVGHVEQYPDGSLNLVRAFVKTAPPQPAPAAAPAEKDEETAKTEESSPPQWPAGLRVALAITSGQVTYLAPGIEPVILNGVAISADLQDPAKMQLSVSSQLAQGQSAGKIDARLGATGLFGPDGRLNLRAANIDLSLEAPTLPIDALDRLLSLDNGLAEAIGPTAQAHVTASGTMDHLTGQVKFSSQRAVVQVNMKDLDARNALAPKGTYDVSVSLTDVPMAAVDKALGAHRKAAAPLPALARVLGPQMTVTLSANGAAEQYSAKFTAHSANLQADAGLQFANKVLAATPQSNITFTGTPDVWAALTSTSGTAAPTTLTQNFIARVDVSRLQLAYGDKGMDLSKSAVTAHLALTPITLATADAGTLQLRDASGQFSSESLADNLGFQLHAVADQNGQAGTVDLTGKASHVLTADGQLTEKGQTLDVNGTITDLPLMVVDRLAQTDGALARVLGPKLNARMIAALKPGENGAASGQFSLNAAAQNLTLDVPTLALTDTPDGITINQGGQATLHIEPALVAALNAPSASSGPPAMGPAATMSSSPSLRQAAQFQLAIGPISIPRKAGVMDLAAAKIALHASTNEITLDDPATFGTATLKSLAAQLSSERLGDKLSFTLDAQTQYANQAGTVHLTGDAASLFDAAGKAAVSGAILALSAQLNAFPTALADVTLGQKGRLVNVLGPQLASVNATLNTQNDHTLVFSAKVASDRLAADTSGKWDPGVAGKTGARLTLAKTPVQFTLTPAAYLSLLTPKDPSAPRPHTTLDAPMTLKVDLAESQIAFLPVHPPKPGKAPAPMQLDAHNSKFGMAISGSGGTFRVASTGQSVRVTSLTASVQSADLSQALAIDLAAAYGDPAGKIAAKAQVHNLTFPASGMDYTAATITPDITIQNLPVAILDDLLGEQGDLIALLGNSASVTLTGTIAPTGKQPLALVVDSQNAKANVAAIISGGLKNGTLQLQNDATASVAVTPQISAAFLKKVTGWVDPASGQNPITLKIHHDDFTAPMSAIHAGDLTHINATAELAMGTLNLKANDPVVGATYVMLDMLSAAATRGNGSGAQAWLGVAQSALDLAGNKGKSTPPETVTFSPMTMALKNGHANYTGLTMTIRDLPFAFTGDVNLMNKANNLTMTLPASAISKKFPQVAKYFTPGNDLVIGVGGTYDKPTPKLDTLAAQVTRFIPAMGGGGDNGKPNAAGLIQDLLGGKPKSSGQPAPAGPGAPAPQGQPGVQSSPTTQPNKKPNAGQIFNDVLQGLEKRQNPPAQTRPAGR